MTTARLNDPLLPSFSQSRTYTDDYEDGTSSIAGSSLASESLASMANESLAASAASANTTATSNAMMSSPGVSPGGYSAKSTRFKSAMTTRARQRRLRRMKERDSSSSEAAPTNSGTVTPGSVNNRSVDGDITPGIPPLPGAGVGSITPGTAAKVQSAKEHVEQMKSYQRVVSPPPDSAPPAPVNPSSPPSPPPAKSNSPLQNRVYQARRAQTSYQRSPSSSPDHLSGYSDGGVRGGMTTSGNPNRMISAHHKRSNSNPISKSPSKSPNTPGSSSSGSSGQSYNYTANMIPMENQPTPPRPNAPRAVTPQQLGTPQRVNGTNVESRQAPTPITNNRTYVDVQSQPNMNMYQHTAHPQAAASKTSTRRSKRDKFEASHPKPEEFLPDWKAQGSNGINPEEVRDAANFTSIQFQCSMSSGQVEILSGDDCTAFDEADGSDSVFSGNSSNVKNGRGIIADNAQQGKGHNRKHSWQNEVWVHSSNRNSNSSGNNDGHSQATTPSILQKGEIFHQKAAASIVSLLSPDRMFEAGLMAPEIENSEEDEAAKDVEGDSPTGVASGMFTFDGDGDPSTFRGSEWRGTKQVSRTLFKDAPHDEADDDVRRSVIFQAFRQKMMQPSPQLSELLGQIHRRTGTEIDRAFATRRKNACGALKILSAKEENRMKICWTVGVLPAIASVLSDVNECTSDELSKAANTEARNRVVSTLLNLSVNKKNRMLIVNTPGVLESISQTIKYDDGESRQGCCTVLLYLAKTSEARATIVKSAGMLDTLATVIEVPKIQPKASSPESKGRKTLMMLGRKQPKSKLSPIHSGDASPGQESYRSRRSGSQRNRSREQTDTEDEEDDSVSRDSDSHTSGHSSQSGSRDSKSDDDGGHSRGSRTVNSEFEQMEISFETAQTAEMENTRAEMASPALSMRSKGSNKSLASRKKSQSMEEEDIYDADPNRFLHGARLSVFACLLCLVKSPDNAFMIAREQITVQALIGVSRRHSSPSHSRAMAIIAHLTRHPKNCHQLVFKYPALLPMLQVTTASPDKEARRYVFCALQNLSMDKSCRIPIAHSPKIIWSLTEKCKEKSTEGTGDEDQARMAAVATLQNLSDEPANLIQFTIVQDCIGTIIQIAREDVQNGEKTDLTSFMAKNTLVTLSHWFRKIATSGSERIGRGGIPHRNGRASPGGTSNISPGGTRTQMLLYNARLEPTVYDQWT